MTVVHSSVQLAGVTRVVIGTSLEEVAYADGGADDTGADDTVADDAGADETGSRAENCPRTAPGTA